MTWLARHVESERTLDQAAMLTLLQTTVGHARSHTAAAMFDEAVKRVASKLDRSDTDEGHERVQNELNAAVLEAIIYVARRNGWRR